MTTDTHSSEESAWLPAWFDRRWITIVLAIAIAGSLTVYFRAATRTHTDLDETQFLSSAAAVNRGEKLYVDIWDNHGPMATYMLVPALRLYNLDTGMYLKDLRILMWCGEIMLLVLAAWIATIVFGRRWNTALLIVLLMLWGAVLFLKGHEIRGDNALNLVWGFALGLWLLARQRRNDWLFGVAGFAIGLGFFFSVKTLLLGFGVALMFGTDMWQTRRLYIRPVIAYGIGAVLAVACMAGWLSTSGMLAAYWHSNITQNFDRVSQPWMRGYLTLQRSDSGWSHIFMVALIYTLVQSVRRRTPPAIACLCVMASWLTIQYVFLLPTKYLQSFLPAILPLSVVLAWTFLDLARALEFRTHAPVAQTAFAVVLGLIAFVTIHRGLDKDLVVDKLGAEVDFEARLSRDIPPGEFVFSGSGRPLSRPAPFRVKSFVRVMREASKADELSFDVLAGLKEKNVRYVLYEKRLSDFDNDTRMYIQHNFIPLKTPLLLAAGKIIPAPGTSHFDIEGDYHWQIEGGDSPLLIDGKPATNPAAIAPGDHDFQWTGPGTLVMCVAPPGSWGNWRLMMERNLPDRSIYEWDIYKSGFWDLGLTPGLRYD